MADNTQQPGITRAAVGYLPALFWLPLFLGKTDDYTRFHGRQSLVLFVLLVLFRVAVWCSDLIVGRLLGSLFVVGLLFQSFAWFVHYPLGFIAGAAYVGAVVVCMVQAAAGNCWRVPVVGAYAERLGSTSNRYTGGNDD